MNINNTTDFGTVKIVMLKGEKGDQGPAGANGTSGDFSLLTNKPSINGFTISGAQTASYYGLADLSDVPTKTSDLTNDGEDEDAGTHYVTATELSAEIDDYEDATDEIKTSINQVATTSSYIGQPSGTLSTSNLAVNLTDNISNYAFIEVIVYYQSNTARSSQIFSVAELTAQPGGSYPPHVFYCGAHEADPMAIEVTYVNDTRLNVRATESQGNHYVRIRGLMPVIQTALS